MTTALLLAIGLQFEAAGGMAQSLDNYTGGYTLRAPALEARASVRLLEYLSVGPAFLAVLGPHALIRTNCGTFSNDPAYKAYAGFVTLRAQSPGAVQLWAEGGAGIGHLVELRGADCFEHPVLTGRSGTAFQVSGGARAAVLPSLALGLELSYARWNGVVLPPNAGPSANAPAVSGLSTDAWLLLATVTFDWIP